MLEGSCHCGAISLQFDTERAPDALPVRLCGCSFCARHRPVYTTDPAGHLTVRVAREEDLVRYRFGLRLADFLLCGTCGVFVAAWEPGSPGRAVVNIAALDRAQAFVAEPTRFTAYDSEDVAARTARRARTWTPATLRVGCPR